MAEKINIRIENKHATEAEWIVNKDFIPLSGEIIIYDKETELTEDEISILSRDYIIPYDRIKIGDGTTKLQNLPFATDKALGEMAIYKEIWTEDFKVGETTRKGFRISENFTSTATIKVLDSVGLEFYLTIDSTGIHLEQEEYTKKGTFEQIILPLSTSIGTAIWWKIEEINIPEDETGIIESYIGKPVEFKLPDLNVAGEHSTSIKLNDTKENKAYGGYSLATGRTTCAGMMGFTITGFASTYYDSYSNLISLDLDDQNRELIEQIFEERTSKGLSRAIPAIYSYSTNYGSYEGSCVLDDLNHSLTHNGVYYGEWIELSGELPSFKGDERLKEPKLTVGYSPDNFDNEINILFFPDYPWLGNRPIGYASHAEGRSTIAARKNSHAEGNKSKALGAHAHAEGNVTVAKGAGAHSEGESTSAQGHGSHAEGQNTKAIANYSHVEGYAGVAGSDYSHAEGWGTNTTGKSDNPNTAIASHAEGKFSKTYADFAHAEGYNTGAKGIASHAEGNTTVASGPASHAEGESTNASGNQSHAEGKKTTAAGEFAHAEGQETAALGGRSHAQGWRNIAYSYDCYAGGGSTNSYETLTKNLGLIPTSKDSWIQIWQEAKDTGNGNLFNAAIGNNSFTQGSNNLVIGLRGIALGIQNRVDGEDAIAVGAYNKIGINDNGSGNHGGAFGYNNQVDTPQSFAIGHSNIVSTPNRAMAIGNGNILKTTTIEGATILGRYGTDEGYNNAVFLIGNGTAADKRFSIFGINSNNTLFFGANNTLTSGAYSAALGYNNVIDAPQAFAIGHSNTVKNYKGIALGVGNILEKSEDKNRTVIGNYNNDDHRSLFAVGNGTSATRSNALELSTAGELRFSRLNVGDLTADYTNTISTRAGAVIGGKNTINRPYSVAVGFKNTIIDKGDCHFIAGSSNTINAGYQNVILGLGNIIDTYSDNVKGKIVVGTYNKSTNAIFTVGNGSAGTTEEPDKNRSNALEIYKNGKIVAPQYTTTLEITYIDEDGAEQTETYKLIGGKEE